MRRISLASPSVVAICLSQTCAAAPVLASPATTTTTATSTTTATTTSTTTTTATSTPTATSQARTSPAAASTVDEANELWLQALDLRKKKEHDSEYQFLIKAASLNPKHKWVHQDLGLYFIKVGESERAMREFRIAQKVNPQNYLAPWELGKHSIEIHQYQAAVIEINESLRRNPSFASAYFDRGMAYREMDQKKKAFADFSKCVQLDPTFREAYNQRADQLMDAKEYKTAEADYSTLVKLKPDSAVALVRRARCRLKMTPPDYDGVISDCTRAIELAPTNQDAHEERIKAYVNTGALKEARDDASKLIVLDPNNASRYKLHAGICTRLKDYAGAAKDEKVVTQLVVKKNE